MWLAGTASMRMTSFVCTIGPGGRGSYHISENPMDRRRYQDGVALVAEAAATLESLDETWLRGFVAIEQSVAACASGNCREAIAHLERALALRESLGDPQGIAAALVGLGDEHLDTGDVEAAAGFEARAREIVMRISDATGLAEAERLRSRIQMARGEFTGARRGALRTIEASLRARFANNVASGIRITGDLARHSGDAAVAAEMHAFSASSSVGTPFTRAASQAALDALRPGLGDHAIERAVSAAQSETVASMAARAMRWLAEQEMGDAERPARGHGAPALAATQPPPATDRQRKEHAVA
jgi:hypothetical protein